MEILEELIKILDFEGTNNNIRVTIENIIDTNPTQEQAELIYELSAYAYELGRKENDV